MRCAALRRRLYADRFDKAGWIADEPTGGESISFPVRHSVRQRGSSAEYSCRAAGDGTQRYSQVRLEQYSCYAVFLGVLRSYKGTVPYPLPIRWVWVCGCVCARVSLCLRVRVCVCVHACLRAHIRMGRRAGVCAAAFVSFLL